MTGQEKKRVLDEIASANGGHLVPDAVVEAARDPSHPFHDTFLWDDSRAAQAYRLDQARELIRSVRVVFEVKERTIKSVYYVSNPDRPEGGEYIAVPKVRTNSQLAAGVVADELRRAAAAIARARDVAASLGFEIDFDSLLLQVQTASEEVSAAEPVAAAG